MKFRRSGINTYLCACAALALFLTGCTSPEEAKPKPNQKKGKEQALLMLHIETVADGTPYSRSITVPRNSTSPLTIEARPFLDNGSLLEAAVVNTDKFGGFAIQLQFNQHGIFALDTITSSSRGKHIAILCHYGQERWLAAPTVTRRISNGLMQFTADVSREEAEYVVRGLNNVAAKLKKKGAL